MRQGCIDAFPKQAVQAGGEAGGKRPLEEKEDIEILRFLEMGYRVQMIEFSNVSIAVDTTSDLERVRKEWV